MSSASYLRVCGKVESLQGWFIYQLAGGETYEISLMLGANILPSADTRGLSERDSSSNPVLSRYWRGKEKGSRQTALVMNWCYELSV